MPQFDTFSFLSQLFWVLSLFCFFYISLAYYLLPAVSVTLKTRQRKLSLSVSSSSSSLVSFNSTFFEKIDSSLDKLPKDDSISPIITGGQEVKIADSLITEKLTNQTFVSNMLSKIFGVVTNK